jgi:hypothetical protein
MSQRCRSRRLGKERFYRTCVGASQALADFVQAQTTISQNRDGPQAQQMRVAVARPQPGTLRRG